jgi:hypothetical protein
MAWVVLALDHVSYVTGLLFVLRLEATLLALLLLVVFGRRLHRRFANRNANPS